MSRSKTILVFSTILLTSALALGGAMEAAPAAAFSALSACLLLAALLMSKTETVARAFTAFLPAAIAYFAFFGYGVFSATPLSSAAAHPQWAAFEQQTASISISPYRTVEGLISSLSAPTFLFLGALSVDVGSDRDRVGKALSAAAIVLSLIALIVYLMDLNGSRRLMLHFGTANAPATTFGMLAFCSAALFLRRQRGASRRGVGARFPRPLRVLNALLAAPLSFTASVFSFVCIILSASRGGILSCAAGACIFAGLVLFASDHGAESDGLDQRAGATKRQGLLPLALISLALIFYGGEVFFQRIGDIHAAVSSRRILVETHYALFMERALWGHGLNTFHELNALGSTPDNWTMVRGIGSTHNVFIQALEEGGLIGAGFLFAAFGYPMIRALWRAIQAKSGREWAAAAVAASAVGLLHGTVDFGLSIPAITALLSFMLGAFTVPSRKRSHVIRNSTDGEEMRIQR